MAEYVFKRKMYDRMLKWKQERAGETALLIQGARRIGKSTLAEQFAKNEYKSYRGTMHILTFCTNKGRMW